MHYCIETWSAPPTVDVQYKQTAIQQQTAIHEKQA